MSVTAEQITGCATVCCYDEKSLESVLARLNRLRATKVDAAEIAGLTDTAAFSIF